MLLNFNALLTGGSIKGTKDPIHILIYSCYAKSHLILIMREPHAMFYLLTNLYLACLGNYMYVRHMYKGKLEQDFVPYIFLFYRLNQN